ncbi:MAG: phosphoribosylglycinamide formyltransferase [Tuberibacillus sp.]
MKKIAVFASGTGSNFEAIEKAIRSGQIKADIALVVCDKPQAPVIEKAKAAGIPVLVLKPKDFPNKAAYEQVILDELKEKGVTFIVLAGYMRLIGSTLLRAYPNKIVNIHPSLLPSFTGLHAIEQAMQARVKVTGVTIHFVDEGMDTGPILAQQPVPIDENDTLETLEARIHEIEHMLYPKTLAALLNQNVKETVSK